MGRGLASRNGVRGPWIGSRRLTGGKRTKEQQDNKQEDRAARIAVMYLHGCYSLSARAYHSINAPFKLYRMQRFHRVTDKSLHIDETAAGYLIRNPRPRRLEPRVACPVQIQTSRRDQVFL